MKAIANTTIRMGLVNIPVQVCQAVESKAGTDLKMGGPGGEVLTQAYLMPDGKTVCPKEDIQKGVRDGDDFYPIDKEALDQIAEATKLPDLNVSDVITLDEFNDFRHRVTGYYYVQANKKAGGVNAFKLFVDALEEQGKCLVTKWTARSRQSLLVMYAKDGNLVANSLCFEGDVREPDESVTLHKDSAYTDKEMEMAKQMLDMLAGTSSNALVMETDEAVPMRNKLIDDARNGKVVTATKVKGAEPTKAGLEDALAASLAAMKG